MHDLVGEKYTVLGKYINNEIKILMQHNSLDCNYSKFEVRPSKFLHEKTRCKICSGTYAPTTTEVEEQIKTLSDGEYELLGEYKNSYTHIAVLHKTCNRKYGVFLHIFKSGSRCPLCYKENNHKKHEDFCRDYNCVNNNKYDVLTEYTGENNKILIRHKKCEKEFMATPKSLLRGKNCPFCKMTKGEEKIYNFLFDKSIKHEYQFRIQDCRNINVLAFDFCVLDKNNNLAFLVEYDGEMHYHINRFIKEKEKALEVLKNAQTRDKIKDEYCKSNNIPLLRIPYWDFNKIEDILEEWLCKYI